VAATTLHLVDAGWIARLRWRRRGAWLWPAFIVMTAVDAALGNALPASGDTESVPGAAIAGLVLNLIAVILLSRPLGALLRRARPDLPGVVARNYAGTSVVVLVSIAILVAGLMHRDSVIANQRAMHDAIARAQAWIGARAPVQFRRNLGMLNTLAIEPGSIYRGCVPSTHGRGSYCVIVNTHAPFPGGVRFAGHEPNSVFAAGDQ